MEFCFRKSLLNTHQQNKNNFKKTKKWEIAHVSVNQTVKETFAINYTSKGVSSTMKKVEMAKDVYVFANVEKVLLFW